MSKTKINLFGEDEFDFYEHYIRFHIKHYVPELFQKDNETAEDLKKRMQHLTAINRIYNRTESGTKDNDSSGAMVMLSGITRPDEVDDKKKLYEKWNAETKELREIGTHSSTSVDETNDLIQFLQFVIQADIPLKPIGYIILKKVQQYSFWQGLSGDGTIEQSRFPDILESWKRFQEYDERQFRWIASAEKKESLDCFAQENIFRCLKLIYQKKKVRFGDTVYLPVRVWVYDVERLYRRKIPYLIARKDDDTSNDFVMLRLDRHVFAEPNDRRNAKNVPSWVPESTILKKMNHMTYTLKGEYFFAEKDYIRGKLNLPSYSGDKEATTPASQTLPYSTEQVYQVSFESKITEMSEAEYMMLMRSCGEFAKFQEEPAADWDSTAAWIESTSSVSQPTPEQSKSNKDIGLIDSENTSFDAVCKPISCMELAIAPSNIRDKTRMKYQGWDALSIPNQKYQLSFAERHWLHEALSQNKELTEVFGLTSFQTSLLSKDETYFRPCEKKCHISTASLDEAVWNQRFQLLQNPFNNKGMQDALKCIREQKLLRYKHKDIDCIIFPYQFQMTKNKELQLLAYDLIKFKLISINKFGGGNDYKEIKIVDLSELSETARRIVYYGSQIQETGEADKEQQRNENRRLAAREIVYYYKLMCSELKQNPYDEKSQKYDCSILEAMLKEMEAVCKSIMKNSVFSPITVNRKRISICSRMVAGDVQTVGQWLIRYQHTLGMLNEHKIPKIPACGEKTEFDVQSFQELYNRLTADGESTKDIVESACSYYDDYIKKNYPSDESSNGFSWNSDVYHPERELVHIYKRMCKIQEGRFSSYAEWASCIKQETRKLLDAKKCTCLLGIKGKLSMERLDMIFHIFNEFNLTTETVVCDPNDFYSEDAEKFEIVHCIRVEYRAFGYRKLHEGILALQDFIYPLTPNDLKSIIRTRQENVKHLYEKKENDNDETVGSKTV